MKRLVQRFIILLAAFFIPSVSFSQNADSVSFSDLFKIALENNYSLIVARNDAEAAKIGNSLGNAGFLPSVNGTAGIGQSVVNSNQEFYNGTSRNAQNAKGSSSNAMVEADWTIFDGMKMFASKQKLNELENQGKIEIQIEIEAVYMQLATYYYDLVQETKYLDVLQSNFAINRNRLELAEKKFSLGSASESDLIQARLDMNADSNTVIRQKVLIRNIKTDINHLLGREPAMEILPTDTIEIHEGLQFTDLLTQAENQNNDLMLARSNEEVNRLTMKGSTSAFLPSVSLYGDYSYATSESQTGFLNTSKSYGPAYGIRFSYNLFSGFTRKQQYQINRINYENAQVQTRELENSIQTELLKSFNNYTSSLQVLAIEKENIADAEKNLRLAVESYKVGQISEIDFRSFQQKSIAAENRLLAAEYAVRMAELSLLKLSGQLKLD